LPIGLVALVAACTGEVASDDQELPGPPLRAAPAPPGTSTITPAGTSTIVPAGTSTITPAGEPEAPAPPASTPPAATPASSPGKPGMLGCPTADAPAYGTGASAALTLSEPYRTTCARCHGASGEGQPLYPALPGQLDRAAFIEVVRRGKGTAMPAFPAAFVSDSELARDFDALAKRPTGQSATGLPNAGEWAWTPGQVERSAAASRSRRRARPE
jgi:mono/diheme cytochrome c family protein